MASSSQNANNDSATVESTEPMPFIPIGFEAVPVKELGEAALNLKSVKSSKRKLWLIKVPQNFDPSTLNGQQVILNGEQELPPLDGQGDQRFQLQAFQYDDEQLCSFRSVLPSLEKECLLPAKPFTGQINVLNNVMTPSIEAQGSRPKVVCQDVSDNLITRWKPFGYKKPRKRSHSIKVENGLEETANKELKKLTPDKKSDNTREKVLSSSEKTKSHKKKKSKKTESREENESQSKQKHKKLKTL